MLYIYVYLTRNIEVTNANNSVGNSKEYCFIQSATVKTEEFETRLE